MREGGTAGADVAAGIAEIASLGVAAGIVDTAAAAQE